MKFFAYGMNMLGAKIMSLVTFPQYRGVGRLQGYQMRFNKRGHKDNSGNTNLVKTGNPKDVVYGVVYEFGDSYKGDIERAEGLGFGYHAETLTVQLEDESIKVTAYVADEGDINDRLLPFEWYRDIVLLAAKQHGLPKEYIQYLESIQVTPDPDSARARIQRMFIENAS